MNQVKIKNILYFEDLLVKNFEKLSHKVQKVLPDDYDELWLGLPRLVKDAYQKADQSYLSDDHLLKVIKKLNDIFNDNTLIFPDLVQKSLDFMITVKELGIFVETGVLQSRLTEKTNAVLSMDTIEGDQFICVDLCYDNETANPNCEVVCIMQEPATAQNIDTAQKLLYQLAQKYQIAVFNDLETSLVKFPVKVEWLDLGEGLNGDYNSKDPEDMPLLRFDVSVYNNGEWEQKEDGSVCARFSADVDIETKHKGLQALMNRLYDVLADDIHISFKKLCEELSWIDDHSFKSFHSASLSVQIQAAKSHTSENNSLSDPEIER